MLKTKHASFLSSKSFITSALDVIEAKYWQYTHTQLHKSYILCDVEDQTR